LYPPITPSFLALERWFRRPVASGTAHADIYAHTYVHLIAKLSMHIHMCMRRTKRVQVLMEPDEFERLEQLALQQGIAVAALIRQAVAERYFGADSQRRDAADRVNRLNFGGIPPRTGGIDPIEDLTSRLTLGRTEGLR
jgi:hypothetical protein